MTSCITDSSPRDARQTARIHLALASLRFAGELDDKSELINTVDTSNLNILSEEEFQRFSILRDQELELHFQHLKIETTEE